MNTKEKFLLQLNKFKNKKFEFSAVSDIRDVLDNSRVSDEVTEALDLAEEQHAIAELKLMDMSDGYKKSWDMFMELKGEIEGLGLDIPSEVDSLGREVDELLDVISDLKSRLENNF
jgi:hypothetical protein|tara:strand:- start:538 stop:885 length:348 start_codon:yes stop_codon:yes gene_type:complete